MHADLRQWCHLTHPHDLAASDWWWHPLPRHARKRPVQRLRMSCRLLGEHMAGVGRVHSQLRHRGYQPRSHDLYGGERWRSGVSHLPRADSAVLDGRMPHRLRDECLAGLGHVFGHMRIWHAQTDPGHNFSRVEWGGCVRFDERGSRMHDRRHLPCGLQNQQLGCMVCVRPSVCIWQLEASTTRDRSISCRRSRVSGPCQRHPMLIAALHRLRHGWLGGVGRLLCGVRRRHQLAFTLFVRLPAWSCPVVYQRH